MQVSDLLGKYAVSTPTSGVNVSQTGQTSTEISKLSAGNVFEGTVGTIKNGQVSLLLSNGNTITARIANGVEITQGQSMFFLVKSNDGNTVEIKPYLQGQTVNPTLTGALSQAGLALSKENLDMVDAMMEQGLPIDRQSLSDMTRLLGSNSNLGVADAANMRSLGIPLTPEMAEQFLNYKNDIQSVTNRMDQIFDSISETFQSTENDDAAMVSFHQNILKSFAEEGTDAYLSHDISERAEQIITKQGDIQEPLSQTSLYTKQTVDEQVLIGADQKLTETSVMESKEAAPETGELPMKQIQTTSQSAFFEKITLLFGKEAADEIFTGHPTSSQIAGRLSDFLENETMADQKNVWDLLGSKEYGQFLKDALQESWLIEPKESGSKEKIKALYERIDRQLEHIEEAIKSSGFKDSSLAKNVSDLRQNLDFMNELNHTVQYIQIPLKMSSGNASGELHVYSNKKNMSDEDGTLSAFLHLDMENLGSTDVSVKMIGKSVDTKFYMDNDDAYQLVMSNIDILKSRIEKKGYQCEISAVCDGNDKGGNDPIRTSLRTESDATHMVHRYSFDMKA